MRRIRVQPVGEVGCAAPCANRRRRVTSLWSVLPRAGRTARRRPTEARSTRCGRQIVDGTVMARAIRRSRCEFGPRILVVRLAQVENPVTLAPVDG